MTLRLYRNTSSRRWGRGRLPGGLRLYWAGPVFILMVPR